MKFALVIFSVIVALAQSTTFRPSSTGRPVTTTESARGCGMTRVQLSESRIVGGQNAVRGEWPWQISLRLSGRHICGGSIITDRFILSAAHCVDSSINPLAYTIVVGEWKQSELTNANRRSHTVKKITVHPDWRRGSVGGPGDIVLIELTNPIDMSNPHVNTICMPPNKTFAGESCWVTGWGFTIASISKTADILQKLQAPLLSNVACNDRISGWNGMIKDYHLCQYRSDGSACRGDSGGPLACKGTDGRYYLAGAVSWGRTSCSDKPAVFSRITYHLQWLRALVPNLD